MKYLGLLYFLVIGGCTKEYQEASAPPPPMFHERIVKDNLGYASVIILEDVDQKSLCYIFVQHITDSTGTQCVVKNPTH